MTKFNIKSETKKLSADTNYNGYISGIALEEHYRHLVYKYLFSSDSHDKEIVTTLDELVMLINDILDSELTYKQKYWLLSLGWDGDTCKRKSPMRRALNDDNSINRLNALLTATLNTSCLTTKDKFNLIACYDSNQRSGLCLALSRGAYKAVEMFVNTILSTSKLTLDQKIILIMPGMYDEPSPLELEENPYLAGHLSTLQNYIVSIIDADQLNNLDKIKILKHLNYGYNLLLDSNKIKMYMPIIASSKFNFKEKYELLTNYYVADTIDQSSNLYLALIWGYTDAAYTYINLINNLDDTILDKNQKIKILQAKNKYGFPLGGVIWSGHKDTVIMYINAILNNKLFTQEQKFEILQGKKENISALNQVLKNHHWACEEATEAYINTVESAENLSLAQKEKLLSK